MKLQMWLWETDEILMFWETDTKDVPSRAVVVLDFGIPPALIITLPFPALSLSLQSINVIDKQIFHKPRFLSCLFPEENYP